MEIDPFQAANRQKQEAIFSVVSDNYSAQSDEETAQNLRNTSEGLREAFNNYLVSANLASNEIFGDHFTIEGLPYLDPLDLRDIVSKYPEIESFADQTVLDPYDEYLRQHGDSREPVSPLYFRLLKMNSDGNIKPLPKGTQVLRGKMYFFAEDGMRKEIRETNTIAPGIDRIRQNYKFATETMHSIIDNTDVPPIIDDVKERLMLASPIDHIRNYALMHFGALLYISHGANFPDLLKKIDSKDVNVKKIYAQSIDEWLTESSDVKKAKTFLDRDYLAVYDSILSVVETYHGFILDGDVDRLRKVSSNFDHIAKVIRLVGNAVRSYEQTVDELLPPDENNDPRQTKKQLNTSHKIKRELFKKILRHERDADHPGINMLHVAQTVKNDGKLDEEQPVLGLAYGGIEYPFIYDTVGRLLDPTYDASSARAFLLLSNYNLEYTPTTAAITSKHLYPPLKLSNKKRVLIFDDNSVSGTTNLQAEEALKHDYPSLQVTVAAADVNIGVNALARHNILRNAILRLGFYGTRTLLARDNHKLPHFLHASRYASNYPSRKKRTK